MSARDRFAACAERLLADASSEAACREAALALYDLCSAAGGLPGVPIGPDVLAWQQDTLLPSGRALNAHAAAACLLDYPRTRAFARGVVAAVRTAQQRFPGERIDLIYAGTGPFAPLALLTTPWFSPDEVSFTLIDVHPAALQALNRVINTFEVNAFVSELVHADASLWQPSPEPRFHVAVAEVMQRGLVAEPQVAVTMALADLLHPRGLLVPERVELSLCLLSPAAEQAMAAAATERLAEYFSMSSDVVPALREALPREALPPRQLLEASFTLTLETARAFAADARGRVALPPVHLPQHLPVDHELRVLTCIRTAGEEVLADYDCGLTFPEPLADPPLLRAGAELALWYETLDVPGLRLAAR